ncbi:hypothetical protein [Sporosarcina sp. FSL K6-1508]|uniref:hypothetical protein n=1 Tax=Sporosarcina sp. FSL K6-1508 TaxID=2921553 RepID=UPI0030F93552
MDGFKHYISTGCISFTFSCIFYFSFSFLNLFPPMDERMVVNMLVISIGIMCLIFVTHLLPIRNFLLFRLLEFVDVIIVLLVAGFVFDMFPFSWSTLAFVVIIGFLTYIVVIFMIFMGNQSSAVQINSVIARGKRSDLNKQDN